MEKPLIYLKMGSIMRSVEPILKDRTNQQQGFKYRGIDDIYNALHKIFAENGVFAVPTVTESKRDERQTKAGATMFHTNLDVKYTFYAEDGSFFEAFVVGEAMDMADKSTNKAMSVAYKYALMQILMIPTEEEKDPDATTPDPGKKQPPPPPKVSAKLPDLEASGTTYEAVVTALKSKKYTIEQVKLKYTLSFDLEEHLKSLIK